MKAKNDNSSSKAGERKYPVRCSECGRREVCPATVRLAVERNHDGRVYKLDVDELPVLKFANCGEVTFTEKSDDRIIAKLRDKLGLLTPDQIRNNLETLGLNQKEAATALGLAPETLSRWLTGGLVQSRSLDRLLRSFFGSLDVRCEFLKAEGPQNFGEVVILNQEVVPNSLVNRMAPCRVVGSFTSGRSEMIVNPYRNVAAASNN